MKILQYNASDSISATVDVLEDGGIIAYPTDTLYGFGADATNDGAIERINQIKGRVGPMSVMAPDIVTALTWMNITPEQTELVAPYLGGAKTLIVPVKPDLVSAKILGIDNTLGIRIPDNKYCNELTNQFGKPIISTSVNRSGEMPINDPDLIHAMFSSEIDLLINNGTVTKKKGSTIYQLKDNNIIVLRK